MEDIKGDSANNVNTFPKINGIRNTLSLILISTIVLIIFSFIPFVYNIYKIEFFIILMVIVILMITMRIMMITMSIVLTRIIRQLHLKRSSSFSFHMSEAPSSQPKMHKDRGEPMRMKMQTSPSGWL